MATVEGRAPGLVESSAVLIATVHVVKAGPTAAALLGAPAGTPIFVRIRKGAAAEGVASEGGATVERG
jgi:hypothetical protein